MKLNKSVGQWFSLVLLGATLIAVYKMFDSLADIAGWIGRLFSILTPFVAGFVIAFLLYAPAKRFEEFFLARKWKFWKKAARPLSVILAYLVLLAILAGIVYLAIPALANALMDFVNNIPTYYSNVMGLVKDLTQEGGLLENVNLSETINELYAFVVNYFTVDRIVGYLRGVVGVTSSIVDAILAFIVSIYMLLGRDSLFRAVRAVSGLVLKNKTVEFLAGYLKKIAKIFYNYVYSQLIDALVVGVLATIGFLLARMPNALALGIMLGLMNMVPYFGAIIGGVICVLIALLSGNLYGALFIGVYILVMQQIDGNIIQPRIVGQSVGLKAIYVLLGITIGGGLFGFWGILLGAPCMAVLQMILTEYIAYRNREKALAAPSETE